MTTTLENVKKSIPSYKPPIFVSYAHQVKTYHNSAIDEIAKKLKQ
jgi:hypothetical protein